MSSLQPPRRILFLSNDIFNTCVETKGRFFSLSFSKIFFSPPSWLIFYRIKYMIRTKMIKVSILKCTQSILEITNVSSKLPNVVSQSPLVITQKKILAIKRLPQSTSELPSEVSNNPSVITLSEHRKFQKIPEKEISQISKPPKPSLTIPNVCQSLMFYNFMDFRGPDFRC